MFKKIFLYFYLLMTTLTFCFIMRSLIISSNLSKLKDISKIEQTVEENFPKKNIFKEIYGFSNKILSPNEIVNSDGSVLVKDKNGYLDSYSNCKFNIDYVIDNIDKLNSFCKDNDTEFVYVSYPSKGSYQDSSRISEKYGITTNGKEIREKFLNGLISKDINVLDIKEKLDNEDYTEADVFYKTDHHWKSIFGLHATTDISNYLNENLNYELDVNLLNKDRFTFKQYDNLWLGETGRKVTYTWNKALDDFTVIEPNYLTSFSIYKSQNIVKENQPFSVFIDNSKYDYSGKLYEYSAHYSYKYANHLTLIHNNNIKNNKKILIIKDSFSVVVIPFLSLEFEEIAVWDNRNVGKEDNLYEYIKSNNFDLVIVAYTDFWNNKMYNFN